MMLYQVTSPCSNSGSNNRAFSASYQCASNQSRSASDERAFSLAVMMHTMRASVMTLDSKARTSECADYQNDAKQERYYAISFINSCHFITSNPESIRLLLRFHYAIEHGYLCVRRKDRSDSFEFLHNRPDLNLLALFI